MKAVDEQAAEVRRLKDDEGMSNSDPEVQEAVSELLARKSALPRLRRAGSREIDATVGNRSLTNTKTI